MRLGNGASLLRRLARLSATCALALIVLTGCSSEPTPPIATPMPLPPMPAAPRDIVRAAADQPVTFATQVDTVWLDDVAELTGIPRRALVGYAGAEIATAQSRPECGIRWSTLAGIGYVESRHGQIFDGMINESGTVSPPVFGVALDGTRFDAIPDTDAGLIDGDTEWDRAVGPMQLLPETWRSWHVDANADGTEDPQNIDDAAVAAANYLCRAAVEVMSVDGWTASIRSYNSAESYRVAVLRAADQYARWSLER